MTFTPIQLGQVEAYVRYLQNLGDDEERMTFEAWYRANIA